MPRPSWKQVLAWLLAAFFVFGGAGNIFASEAIIEDYLRWGYPDWFHYVTGSLELTTAVLLAREPTRVWGAALGGLAMFAAAATVVANGEYAHAIPPVLVLIMAGIVGWAAWRAQPQPVGAGAS